MKQKAWLHWPADPSLEADPQLQALRQAFEFFNETTSKVEAAYAKLEERVGQLDLELQQRNQELKARLVELDTVKNYLDSILESMTSGLIAVDSQGRITVLNRAAERLRGVAREAAMGRPYAEVFPWDAISFQSLLYTLQTRKPILRQEKEIASATGEIIPVRYGTALVLGKDHAVLGAMEMFQDVTEIRKLEEEVQQSKTLAALGEMASHVAHQIRNPLGGIGGFAALLERELTPEDPRQRLVKRIIEGIASLDRIVSELLLYTRPVKANFREVELRALIAEILSFVEMRLHQRELPIQVKRTFPRRDVVAKVDPQLFQEALSNLIQNAIHAMPRGGVLRVRLRVSRGTVHLTVRDTGDGIDEAASEKIFYPFFSTKPSGTGMGLAIVKKIVELHRGSIEVKSERGRGSTFLISLPLSDEVESCRKSESWW